MLGRNRSATRALTDSRYLPILSRSAFDRLEQELRINDSIKDSIVFVGGVNDAGTFLPYGTGFIVCTTINEKVYQSVVTAKHVIDHAVGDFGQGGVRIRVNTRAGEARILRSAEWFPHPDKNVDVSVASANISREEFAFQMLNLEGDLVLSDEKIGEFDIGLGDEVFVVGMFVRVIGELRNLPIVRGGIIALMPEEKIETQYGYHNAYLVESRSFDGLSGSPVFVHPQPFRYTRNNEVTQSRYSHHLMGMMLGHHLVSNPRDTIEILGKNNKPTGEIVRPLLNTGIGIVVPYQYILEAINQPEIVERRMNAENEKLKGGRYVSDSAKPEPPATDENPSHREDFNSLLGAAMRTARQDN